MSVSAFARVMCLILISLTLWQYPLCTLLVFDSRHHALPVAWIISRSYLKSDVEKWMKILLQRAQSVEPGFKINGFIIDDAATEIDPIRHE